MIELHAHVITDKVRDVVLNLSMSEQDVLLHNQIYVELELIQQYNKNGDELILPISHGLCHVTRSTFNKPVVNQVASKSCRLSLIRFA